MSLAKTLLRTTTLIAALGSSIAAAHAAPMLYAEAADETAGTYFSLAPNSSTNGNLSTTATNAAGSTVTISAQGVPLNNGLATTALDASSTAPRSLVIAVTETGLIATSSTMPFMLTFTLNGLLAPNSAASYYDFISSTNAIFDTSSADLIKSATLTGSNMTNELDTSGIATGLTVGQTYSATEFIRLSFGAAGSLSGTSQLLPPTPTAVPEPASMALLGAGLVGLGMVRRRRQG